MNSAAAYIPVFHDPSDKSHDGAVAILADVIQPTQADTKPLSHEDQLAAEYERGRSEGMHAAEDIAAAELATLKEEQEALLVEVRQSLEQTYAEQLTASLETAFADLEERLASSLSCLLLPFLESNAADRIVDSFAETLRGLWHGPNDPVLKVKGPASLLSRLETQMGADGQQIEFIEADQGDLQAVLGTTVIESQLERWVSMITEAGETQS